MLYVDSLSKEPATTKISCEFHLYSNGDSFLPWNILPYMAELCKSIQSFSDYLITLNPQNYIKGHILL